MTTRSLNQGAVRSERAKKAAATRTTVAPAATFHCWLIARPITALSDPRSMASAVIAGIERVQSRAVEAGATINATARMVPTAGTEVTIVTSTASSTRRSRATAGYPSAVLPVRSKAPRVSSFPSRSRTVMVTAATSPLVIRSARWTVRTEPTR
jgi:hypothetical protein